jgi:hypothetical protein
MPEIAPVQPAPLARLARKILMFGLKTAVAAGLIYWLIQKNLLNFKSLEEIRFDGRTVMLVLAAALCVAVGLLLLAWRFRLLLEFQRIQVPFGRALGLTLIGSFFGAVLPGLVGGDVVKAVYACADAPGRRADAVAAVMIDRAIGLYSLMLLGTIALLVTLAAGMLPFDMAVLWVAPISIAVGTACMLLLAWPRFRHLSPIQRMFERMPEKLQHLLKALTAYVKNPRVMVQAVGLSLANHGLVVISFLATARLLGDGLSAFTHFVLNPLAMSMNAVAVSPGGIGFAETAFGYLFKWAGSDHGAMVGLVIQYVVFTLGGTVALLATRAKRKMPPARVEPRES